MTLLLTVGGVTTALTVLWVLVIRVQRRRHRKETRIAHVRGIAVVLAGYFGTHRPEELHGDPVAHGNWIIQLLAPIPGWGAAAFLRDLAERHVSAQRYPEALEDCKSPEFEARAKAIGSVCEMLFKDEEHAS